MLISFFLFETYKEDVLEEVMPIGSYATTVRRKALDFAAKIIGTGRQLILKVTQTVMDNLQFDILWQRSQNPYQYHLVVTILKLKTKLSVGEVRPCSVKSDQRRDSKSFF